MGMLVLSWVFTSTVAVPMEAPQVVRVYADVALKESLVQLERKFHSSHPGVTLKFQTGSSGRVFASDEKPDADVYLVAGEATLLRKSSGVMPRKFADTRLTIVTPFDQTEINSITDLARAETVLVAKPSDPSHWYAKRLFAQAVQAYGRGWLGIVERHLNDDSADVRAVLAKVGAGDAAAGIVYATDAKAYSKVRSVPIAPGLNGTVTFSVLANRDSKVRSAASQWVEFLFSTPAQNILKHRGFSSPLDPVAELPVFFNDESLRVFAKSVGTLPQATARIDGQNYRGADLRAMIQTAKGTQVRVAGADGLTVTLRLADLRAKGALLVKMDSGNLQLVLPGEPQTRWVRWLRSIRVL